MNTKWQFGLAFLVQQITLFCVILALWRPFIWCFGSGPYISLGNHLANCLAGIVTTLIFAATGAFVEAFWSKTIRGAVVGAVIGFVYGVLCSKWVVVD